MRVSVVIGGATGDWSNAREAATATEAAGLDGISFADHIGYPVGRHILDPFTLATGLALATTRIKIEIGVAAITFREPGIVAKMASSIQLVSSGRLILGLGAGNRRSEHEMYGIRFPPDRERVSRLDEYVQVVRALCRAGDPVSFAGTYYALREARNLPAPDPPVAIAVGGAGTRILGIVARHADIWNCPDTYLDRIAERSARLDELVRGTGRTVARTLQIPLAERPLPEEMLRYRPTLGLGAFGTAEVVLERVRELATTARFDELQLVPFGREGFFWALGLVPRIREIAA